MRTYYVRMKNITLSADEDLISKGLSYAQSHNTTLNQLIRDLLSQKVLCTQKESIQEVFDLLDRHPATVTGYHFNREDAYDV